MFQNRYDILILPVFLFAFLWLTFLLPYFFSFFLSADSLWKFHFKLRSAFDNLITDAHYLLITNLLQKRDICETDHLILLFKVNDNETEPKITNPQTYHWKED